MKDLDIQNNGKPCIYKITNMINNKVYIGFGSGHFRRKAQHFWMLRNDRHFNSHLQSSWNKHKEENFEFEILEFLTDLSIRDEREEYYIKKYNATNRESGYNSRPNCNTNLGIKWSEESKRKFSESKKGKPILHINYEKLAEKARKKIIGVHKETKEILYFNSLKEASITLSIDKTSISKALNKHIKSSGGYNWYFNEESLFNNSVNCLETPVKDNQQPSLSSNALEGSTTSSESLEDDNSTTSAGQPIFPYKLSDNCYALNMKALEEFDRVMRKKVEDIV